MVNSRRCEICNVDVDRTSMQKPFRSKKHLENEKQNEMIIPEWFFEEEQTPIQKKIKKVYNSKTFKEIIRENFIIKNS